MTENMTYEPVQTIDDVRRDRDAVLAANGTLNKRVRELEAQLNAAVLGQRELERERDELRAKLDAVPVGAITKLRAHLSTDGDYSIRRTDGASMWIGETIMLGNVFESIDKWLDVPQAVQP